MCSLSSSVPASFSLLLLCLGWLCCCWRYFLLAGASAVFVQQQTDPMFGHLQTTSCLSAFFPVRFSRR